MAASQVKSGKQQNIPNNIVAILVLEIGILTSEWLNSQEAEVLQSCQSDVIGGDGSGADSHQKPERLSRGAPLRSGRRGEVLRAGHRRRRRSVRRQRSQGEFAKVVGTFDFSKNESVR